MSTTEYKKIGNVNALAIHLAKNLPFYTKEQILFVLNSYPVKPPKAKKTPPVLPPNDGVYLVPDYTPKVPKNNDKYILVVGEKTRALTGDFALFNKKHSKTNLVLRFNYYTSFGPAWILYDRSLLEELVDIIKEAKVEMVVLNSEELRVQMEKLNE